MSLTLTKKTLLFSTLALSLFTATAQADELAPIWTARSVEEIKADMMAHADKQTYVIKYGDTLSAIAQALNVDMTVLAQVNQIANINLIFPDTTLTVTTNSQEEVTSIEIQAPQSEETEDTASATVDLDKQQVVVDNQVIPIEDGTAQTEVPSTDATPSDSGEATAPSNPAPADQPRAEPAPATEAPVAQAPSAEIPQTVAPTPAVPATNASDFASIAAANPVNAGLQPQTAAFKEEVASIYGITSFSLYRPGDSGDHGKGLAVDFMVGTNAGLGDQVASYAIQQMGNKNISYIIWKQRFYAPYPNIYGPANTWNLMPDRGSITENHYDHVHVSMNP
ncbi:LysM peptidoglycan-binding domain-containing protein [Streptococcus cuniculi]|uniref:LysM peptidoglycan-binding domain-containing protein n=1 Tax=Streptococcus cuniculi TaxID=1432788 RepID=A0A4Y9J964_9STRE|nr:LysM domain-containing protein [Streptococcus cuniculi]MBF0779300.1 LysM peptidoglycan-binding domain-containing protein [Streptococcus cuniculi]TFU96718.1 LysM peptidoglycan-binding domain-containing protein [Streptococcus cuniculi]